MATFDPFTEQILGLRDQQALAQKLRDQGLQAPEGQTVSGVYVAPSNTQYLAQALKSYLGGQDVQTAQQGIKDLMAQRQAERQNWLQGAPAEKTYQIEDRTGMKPDEVGPSPLSKALRVKPSIEDTLAWYTKMPGASEEVIGQGVLKGAELEANRQARIAEAQIKAQERAQEQRQRQEDRQENMRFAASLRPAPQEKPLTEFQGKSTMFGTRAAQAHNILNSLEENVEPWKVALSRSGGMLTNWALPEEALKVEQAQRDFINAVLRQESGASIGSQEFDSAKRQYFPQPGDGPEVIAQKRANRDLVIKGFARQAGGGAGDIAEIYNAGAPALSAPAANNKNVKVNY
jgi:hypothetical protein